MKEITPEAIDALLPQTQCGLCGYGGCLPYAEALVFEQAAINLCPPGGVKTLNALAAYLQQDPAPFIEDMQKQAKPASVVNIREAECIGCTKCIQACPVDAIIGSAKHMHTVLTAECTGCDLCIPACPVDCIDIISIDQTVADDINKRNHARQRFQARTIRINKEKAEKDAIKKTGSLSTKKAYLQAAILRAKAKKS